MPLSAAISSLSNAYTMRWRAGCIFDLNSSDVMFTLGTVSVPGSRSLSLMGLPEMCFARCAALHSLVMSMLVRIIEDFHGCWLESFVDL